MHTDRFSLRTARGRRIMLPIMLATMLNPLNSSLILTALVPIGNEFGAGPLQTGWLIGGLYLSSAVAQTPLGKCVDLLGARRTMLVGLSVAAIAAVCGALAPSLGWLIAARVLLGFGTSAGFPASMALLRRVSDGAAIPTGALSLVTIATQISTSVGPAFSGVMVVLFGWRSTLAVNIPISIVAFIMVLLWLPKDDERADGGWRAIVAQIDVPGILLFASALTAIMLSSETFVPRVVTLGAAVVLIGAFVARELTCERPFLDLRLIARARGLDRTIARQALAMVTIYSLFYGVAEWLEDTRGASPQVVGIMMVPIALVALVTAATLARVTSPRIALVIGSLGGGIACVLLLVLGRDVSLPWIAAALAVSGLMNGFNAVANQSALYAQAPAGHIGVASGLFRSMQYVGAMLSSIVMGLAFGARADDAGFHRMMIIGGAVAFVLAGAALIDRTIPARGARPAR